MECRYTFDGLIRNVFVILKKKKYSTGITCTNQYFRNTASLDLGSIKFNICEQGTLCAWECGCLMWLRAQGSLQVEVFVGGNSSLPCCNRQYPGQVAYMYELGRDIVCIHTFTAESGSLKTVGPFLCSFSHYRDGLFHNRWDLLPLPSSGFVTASLEPTLFPPWDL